MVPEPENPYCLTTWSDWSECSPCGDGFKSRTRECNCDECRDERRLEDFASCPARCGVTEWSEWEACPATCGDLSQYSTRRVRNCADLTCEPYKNTVWCAANCGICMCREELEETKPCL